MLIGYTCVRNAIKLDYCVDLTILSMLPVCDIVYVCDSSSNDGTREAIRDWIGREPKLRLMHRDWEEPNGKLAWLIEWMQWTQDRLPKAEGYSHLYLDADEVLDPSGYARIREAHKNRESLWFARHNYWRDAKTIAPHGTVCAHEVARFGPSHLPMYSDEIHDGVQFPLPEPEMRVKGVKHPSLLIHHYGFLRKREALFAKTAVNLKAFFGQDQDGRLIEAMKHPEKHWTDFAPFRKPLIPFTGKHPDFCEMWLKERGAL